MEYAVKFTEYVRKLEVALKCSFLKCLFLANVSSVRTLAAILADAISNALSWKPAVYSRLMPRSENLPHN